MKRGLLYGWNMHIAIDLGAQGVGYRHLVHVQVNEEDLAQARVPLRRARRHRQVIEYAPSCGAGRGIRICTPLRGGQGHIECSPPRGAGRRETRCATQHSGRGHMHHAVLCNNRASCNIKGFDGLLHFKHVQSTNRAWQLQGGRGLISSAT